MEECKDCKTKEKKDVMPKITINITYNDNRVNEDHSNYIDKVEMDSEE